ncbi:hypothetical protein [Bacillus massilinigeriensis]|nr:hypothetical protein [Bacillus mediterraneensis]
MVVVRVICGLKKWSSTLQPSPPSRFLLKSDWCVYESGVRLARKKTTF